MFLLKDASGDKYSIYDTFDNTVAILWDHVTGTSNYIIYRSVNSENDLFLVFS